jgi:thioredoxin-related protein
MRRMLILLVASGIWLQTHAADLNWGTNLPKALAQANADKKLVLIDFTGSDWCPWCIKFDKEALDTGKFAAYAKSHLELVLADFPLKKTQSAALKAANTKLQEKYNVEAFPTLVVLNSDGKEIGRQVGYRPGGPAAFIAEIKGDQK